MALIVSDTATNLMREYVQSQVVRLSLHPTAPTTSNEISSTAGYASPSLGQGSWADIDGGEASNTLALQAGTLVSSVPLISDFALRGTNEEVLLSNALNNDRGPLGIGTRLRIAAGALSLVFVTARDTGDSDLAISNGLRTGLINTITNAAISASLHSAQPTDASRPTDQRELSTSTGYRRATLNPANWSSPALDGVTRNEVIISFGGELTSAIASATHVALRDVSGNILVENDLTPVLTNLAIGRSITIPVQSLTLRMLA